MAKRSRKLRLLIAISFIIGVFVVANVMFEFQTRKNLKISEIQAMDPAPAGVQMSSEKVTCIPRAGTSYDYIDRRYVTTLSEDQLVTAYNDSTSRAEWTGQPEDATPLGQFKQLRYSKMFKSKTVSLDVYVPNPPTDVNTDGTYEYRVVLQAPAWKRSCTSS